MIGSAKNNRGDAADAIASWLMPSLVSRTNRFLKALLVAFLVFSGMPVATSHAQSHFSTGGQAHIALVSQSDAQDDSDAGGTLFNGLEHHVCSCPCVQPVPTRSHYISAFLEGSRVNYPAYLDTLGDSLEPDPIHEPPRSIAGA